MKNIKTRLLTFFLEVLSFVAKLLYLAGFNEPQILKAFRATRPVLRYLSGGQI